MKRKRKRCVLAVLLMFVLVLPGCGRKQEAPAAEASLFAMNTYMTFTAYGERAEEALDAARQQIQDVEALWSVTDENSEIYRANHSGGQTIQVSEETAAILSFALEMAEKTGGALDPTIYPVLEAWGFTTDQKQVPSDEEIASLLAYVGYSRISLEGTQLTVPEGDGAGSRRCGKGIYSRPGHGDAGRVRSGIGRDQSGRKCSGNRFQTGRERLADRDTGTLGRGKSWDPGSQRRGGW